MIYSLVLRQARLLLWALNLAQGAQRPESAVKVTKQLGLGGTAWGRSPFIHSAGEIGNLGRERTA